MEENKQKAEMPEDLDAYIIKGMTEYHWSPEFMIKDLQRFGLEEQIAWSIVSRVAKENNIGRSSSHDDTSSDDDDTIFSQRMSDGAAIAVAVASFAGLVFALAKSSFAELAMFLVVMLLVGAAILYFLLTIPTDKRIVRKMNKMGFKCYMDEGRIAFKRQTLNWNIIPWNIKKRYRRITFGISFTDKNLDIDHALTNRIFCIIASRNRHVTLTWNGTDAFACEFHTVFTSTRDIEREFKTAMSVIDDTMNELYTLFQRAFAQQPTETEHKIGFHVGEDTSTAEDSSSQIRAQNETETTN